MGKSTTQESKYQILPLSLIQPNDGQIEGLPANPRQINEQKYELLKKNITDYPELLEYRGLLVYPHDGKYITIGGNMRLRALSELNYKEAPCAVLPADTTVEQLKAYIILDNDNFGQWDWDMLANEWDENILNNLGIELPMDLNASDLFDETNEAKEKHVDDWFINIECKDEQECQQLYNELIEKGVECKIIH